MSAAPRSATSPRTIRAPALNVANANERICVGIIGFSTTCGPGYPHAMELQMYERQNNAAVVAICDLYSGSRNMAIKSLGLKSSDTFLDYRKLLERKDVDAVIVAVHDPWHAQICLDAIEAGKQIYCELPLTRYLDEAFAVHDRVKNSRVVFQAGALSSSAGAWRQAAEFIKLGKLGALIWGEIAYCRNNPRGEWNFPIPQEVSAENIDWERWLGPVKTKVSFSPEHFRRWHKYYAYSCGPLGHLGAARLHALLLASGKSEFPVRVNCISTQNVHTDHGFAPEREVPEHVHLQAELESGFLVHLTCSTENAKAPGFAIYGHKGTLKCGWSGERIELSPEEAFKDEIAAEHHENLPPESYARTHKEWFDCIRSGTQPVADIESALRVQTIISLAEMSDRLKFTFLFDPRRRRITNEAGHDIPPITYGSLQGS